METEPNLANSTNIQQKPPTSEEDSDNELDRAFIAEDAQQMIPDDNSESH